MWYEIISSPLFWANLARCRVQRKGSLRGVCSSSPSCQSTCGRNLRLWGWIQGRRSCRISRFKDFNGSSCGFVESRGDRICLWWIWDISTKRMPLLPTMHQHLLLQASQSSGRIEFDWSFWFRICPVVLDVCRPCECRRRTWSFPKKRRKNAKRCELWCRVAGNRQSSWPSSALIRSKVPNTTIYEVSPVVDNLLASWVFHGDLHELFEDRVVPMVPVLELVEVGFNVGRQLCHQINNYY